jgi:hypothetical protein
MKKAALLALGLLVSGCQSSVQQGPGFASAFPASEWSKRGIGSRTTYVCKTESCGGEKTELNFESIAANGQAPELGIAGGRKIEEEFRNRASVRTTLVAMLRQVLRSEEDRDITLNMTYFTNADYVGYNISGYSPKTGLHVLGEVRIDDNTIIIIGVTSEENSRLRPLLTKFVNNLSIKGPA